LSISDVLAAENLRLYDGVDDDELIAVAEFVENEQAAAVEECPLTNDDIISATREY